MIARCQFCGGSADETLSDARSWTFFVCRRPNSLNARISNAGPSRWHYASERDLWLLEFRVARLNNDIAKATGKRRLVVTRFYGGKEKLMDYANLVGGMKPVIDAMVRENLLVDDDPANLEDHYRQFRVTKEDGKTGVLFQLAELRRIEQDQP